MGLENKNATKSMDEVKYQDYTYVVISTLNQVVNIIPYKIYRFNDVYNMTITDSPYFKNEEFNKNLGLTFKDTLSFTQLKMNSVSGIVEKLKGFFPKKENEKIFWNITGGQRPFILAISEFIKDRDDDVLCYLEGNSSTMTIMDKKKSKEYDYHQSYVNIKEALKLMGFEFRNIKTKEGKDDERNCYLKLYQLYIENQKLREEFIALNETTKALCRDFVNNSQFKNDLEKINFCKNTEDDFNQQYPFGYILEKLAFYQLEKEIKAKVESLVHSLKIIFSDEKKQKESGNKTNDEFDIAILTKNGKFIIFECKSGGMSGDVAKSTNYSTYAISGVYGKPILITPIMESEIKDINTLDKETYGKIKSAIKSAKRATLDVWGIDKIADNIIDYIK
ncbi:MAG: hypothetical protein KU38_04450 [Sulfurovum sp. FS08-3]|nr:MAG: hypothetical protein KU38_04450 [Sulfurovum sp. FS08-3]